MTSIRAISLVALLLAAGCTASHATDPDAPSPLADAGAPGRCRGLDWIDTAPIVRSHGRFVSPALTGDGDGFLFATTARLPDSCEDARCVWIERLPSSGEGSSYWLPSALPPSDRTVFFADTDAVGAAHLAIADSARAERLAVFVGPDWDRPTVVMPLDVERGLGTVAFDEASAWVVTHGWMSEGTIGEGGDFPIHPQIVRLTGDGEATEVSGPDASEGVLFIDVRLALSGPRAWMTTRGFYGGPLRFAGPGGEGALREWIVGPHESVALASGALVVAHVGEGTLGVDRVAVDGTRRSVASLPPAAMYSSLALASDGVHAIVAYRGEAGAVQVTVLDEDLAVLAAGVVPGSEALGEYVQLDVAAANDGTFAVMLAPSGGGDAVEWPVEMRRFRACE